MLGTQTICEIHSGDESSFSGRTADMRDVGILVVLTQGADDAPMQGYLGSKICQVQMTCFS